MVLVSVTMYISEAHKKALLQLLRQIRLEANLHQSDLAEKLNRPQSFVSKYERGERRLDLLELKAVCHAAEISLTDFITRFESIIDEGR